MKKSFLLFFLIALYVWMIFPFTSYLKTRPLLDKLGYVPQSEVLTIASGDQKQITSASLIMKVLFYFGGHVERSRINRIYEAPDFNGMSNIFEAAVKLDPYNMDAYYFAQAILVWDMNQVRASNDLLEFGMKYRTWDFLLPFFAGFNYGYFLKDYAKAAHYFKRVGDLTGNELAIKLASRYFYESGHTDLGIAYLEMMMRTAGNTSIRKNFQIRLEALKAARKIEIARDRYREKFGRTPPALDVLLKKGYLSEAPDDPYGGVFYLDEKGYVRSTSKFALTGEKK